MRLALTTAALSALLTLPALAEDSFPATLAGHAVIPADTMIPAPADAPEDAHISGKFTGPAPNRVPGSTPGDTGPAYGNHPTGLSLPFKGQPFQGMSGFAMNRADAVSYTHLRAHET